MNAAVHPQPSAFSVFPSYPNQEVRRMSWHLFAKSPHLAHPKAFNELTHPLCYQCVTASLAILSSLNFVPSNLFNHIQPLFQKMGGGVPALSFSSLRQSQSIRHELGLPACRYIPR